MPLDPIALAAAEAENFDPVRMQELLRILKSKPETLFEFIFEKCFGWSTFAPTSAKENPTSPARIFFDTTPDAMVKVFRVVFEKQLADYTHAQLLKTYDFVGPEFEGLRSARDKNGKWLHLLHDDTPAYKQRYDWVGIFCQGLCRVQDNGKWFHIIRTGLGIVPAYKQRFDTYVGDFTHGTAPAHDNGEQFNIRQDGTRTE